MKFIVMSDKWQENEWNGTVADTAFWDLQEAAYKLFGAVEDMQSCNLDDESDKWLENLKEKLNAIDNADIEYSGEEMKGLILAEE